MRLQKSNYLKMLETDPDVNISTAQSEILRFILTYYNGHRFECPDVEIVRDWVEHKVASEHMIAEFRTICSIPQQQTGQMFDHFIDLLKLGWIDAYMKTKVTEVYKINNDGIPGKKKGQVIQGLESSLLHNRNMIHTLEMLTQNQSDSVVTANVDVMFDKVDPKILPFPFPSMSRHKIGRTEMVFYIAWTGVGKSSHLIFTTAYWSYMGYNGIIFPLEMDRDTVFRMYWQNLHNNFTHPKNPIPYDRVKNRTYTDQDLQELMQIKAHDGFGELKGGYIPHLNADHIRSESMKFQEELMQKGKTLDFIIVDYPGQMGKNLPGVHIDYTQYLNRAVIDLKQLAMDMKIPVIGAYQLNRESQRRADGADNDYGKRPKLYMISQANEVERQDRIIFLHERYRDDRTGIRNIELIMAKARDENSGDNVIYPMSYDPSSKVWQECEIVEKGDDDVGVVKIPLDV